MPSGKIYDPGGLSLGLKGSILFLEIVFYLNFWGSSEAAMGRGAQRPFGVFMSSKGRVRAADRRAADRRARVAKTH